MNKKFFWTIPLIIFIGIVMLTFQHQTKSSPNLENITVGIQTSPAMPLVMVAKDKGFFEEQGLKVDLKEFTAGKFALEAFLAGSLDFAISGDVPGALAILQGNKFLVPAQVVRETHNEVRIVGRKEQDL